uniref:Uncharacterized protein n=1 Tax=Clytia hemisphaerica TaxID=252671 RepID=A0A7M5UD60_9CNID
MSWVIIDWDDSGLTCNSINDSNVSWGATATGVPGVGDIVSCKTGSHGKVFLVFNTKREANDHYNRIAPPKPRDVTTKASRKVAKRKIDKEFETDLDSIATGSPASLPKKQADPKELLSRQNQQELLRSIEDNLSKE